jgi:GAF domain-containing protein
MQVSRSADLAAEPALTAGARFGGARSYMCVPMLKDDVLIGTISIYRQQLRPFTDKQIALVQNFANQAVIAIENARLMNELRQRTTDLGESLERQTATSEVLQVISSSPGELGPVFDAVLGKATRICEAKFGNLFLRTGAAFRAVAVHNVDWYRQEPLLDMADIANTPLSQIAESKEVIQFRDLREHQAYLAQNPCLVALVESAGARTILGVPLLKEDELIGAIFIYRLEVRAFTEKQIELVKNFAAQAVIAIENTRLLNELRESLQRQTATADVLKVISRSTFDLQTVLDTLVESPKRFPFDTKVFHVTCWRWSKSFDALYRREGPRPGSWPLCLDYPLYH